MSTDRCDCKKYVFKHLFLVTRTDDVDYDQTAAFVVIADNSADALAVAKAHPNQIPEFWDNANVELLGRARPELSTKNSIVLQDFRAG